jgi:hypothetical protein
LAGSRPDKFWPKVSAIIPTSVQKDEGPAYQAEKGYFMSELLNNEAFLEFMTTGEPRPLKFSQNPDQVRELLGEPDDVGRPFSGTDHDNLLTLIYGDLSVGFLRGSMVQICIVVHHVMNDKPADLPGGLDTSWYEAVRQLDYHGFIDYCRKHGIQCYRIVDESLETDEVVLIRPMGIEIEITFLSDFDYRTNDIVSTIPGGPRNVQVEMC